MRRLHLFEIEDQTWFPAAIRDGLTDFLRFIWETGRVHRPVLPVLRKAMETTGAERIVDLCSGGSGPVRLLQEDLEKDGLTLAVVMTDKFPNHEAFERTKVLSGGKVDYIAESVDATAVPEELKGFRTLFTSFHHFRPETARQILVDAAAKGQPIGIFETPRVRLPVWP